MRCLGSRRIHFPIIAPGSVLITIIAPDFVNDRPAGLVAPGVMILTATRLPLLPTFVISIVTAGLLRHMIG